MNAVPALSAWVPANPADVLQEAGSNSGATWAASRSCGATKPRFHMSLGPLVLVTRCGSLPTEVEFSICRGWHTPPCFVRPLPHTQLPPHAFGMKFGMPDGAAGRRGVVGDSTLLPAATARGTKGRTAEQERRGAEISLKPLRQGNASSSWSSFCCGLGVVQPSSGARRATPHPPF
jgi:hypothetical protein